MRPARRTSVFYLLFITAIAAAFILAAVFSAASLPHPAHAAPPPEPGSLELFSLEPTGGITETLAYLPVVRRCSTLYFDDFSDTGTGWPEDDWGVLLYEYKNGEYRILIRESFWWAAAVNPFFTDYFLTVDVRNVTAKEGAYGLLFGQVSDWSGFYVFAIDPFQGYVLWRYTEPNWTVLKTGSSSALLAGAASNRLGVERSGSDIHLYANGEMIASVTDGTFTGLRRIGVFSTVWDEVNLDIRFDDFKVEPLGCGWSTSTSLGPELDFIPEGETGAAPARMDPSAPPRW